MDIKFIIQVDTLCHRIPNFIPKAGRAGVARVFIGLESINPESLLAAKKRQNRITEYRKMLLDWKSVGTTTYAGYILGFPSDTPESLLRDIEIIKRELPLDLLEFFCLTPLPGSEDHLNLFKKGVEMDPDLNKYDLEHVLTAHPQMSKPQWEALYQQAWSAFYSDDHIETLLRRATATGISAGKTLFLLMWFYGSVFAEKVHPLQGGYFRLKSRRDRRPPLPLENPLIFYPRYVAELAVKHAHMARVIWKFARIRSALRRDPHAKEYMDQAITPVAEDELETLEMFGINDSAKAAVTKARREEQARARIGA